MHQKIERRHDFRGNLRRGKSNSFGQGKQSGIEGNKREVRTEDTILIS